MSRLFEIIMEIIYWILIFLSPFLALSIIGIIVYLNNPDNSWVSIVLFIIGAILGTILAEKIRRKYGTTTYMGRIRGNSEFIETKSEKKDT